MLNAVLETAEQLQSTYITRSSLPNSSTTPLYREMFCVLHLGICLLLGYPFSAILLLIQVSAAVALRPNTLFHILHSPISAFQGSYLPTMSYRSHAGFKTCAIGYGDSTLNTTRGRSSVVLLARGFVASGGNGHPIFDTPGSALAKAALENSGGDLDGAISDVFHQRLAKLREEDAKFGGRIRDLSAAGEQKNNQPG